MNATELAEIIERFVTGGGSCYDWDDYIMSPEYSDSELEIARRQCLNVEWKHPRTRPDEWCSDSGGEELLKIALRLRHSANERNRGST